MGVKLLETLEKFGHYEWILGVLLGALASFVSNLGVMLQKYQHVLNNSIKSSSSTNETYVNQPWWRLGFALVVLGSIADFAALSFCPQSLVAPLGSLSLVSNAIFSPLLLNEKITYRDKLATLTIVIGSVLTVAFASHADVSLDRQQLTALFGGATFALYAAVVGMAIISLLAFIKHMERIEPTRPGVEPVAEYVRLGQLHRFAYPCISGIIGAQSVVFAKCTGKMLVRTLQGHEFMFFHVESYLIVASMLATVSLQIKWLNEGLKRFDAAYTVPVFMAFWITGSVVSGFFLYREAEGLSPSRFYGFLSGLLITILGVLALSRHRDNTACLGPPPLQLVEPSVRARLSRTSSAPSMAASATAGTSKPGAAGAAIFEDTTDSLDPEEDICDEEAALMPTASARVTSR